MQARHMDTCPSKGGVTFESLITERCQVAIFVTARKEAAFVAGDFNAALGYLKRANTFLKSRKIAIVAIALRFAPRLLLRLQDLRNHVLLPERKQAPQ